MNGVLVVSERDKYENKIKMERIKLPGVKFLRGWGNEKTSPGRFFLDEYGMIQHRDWLDHLYRLRVDGRTIYRSEPYWLSRKGREDLALIEENGWHVTIGGEHWHWPTTVVISIERDS